MINGVFAMDITFDLVSDATIDIGLTQNTLVRTGVMKGFDTTLPSPQIMAAATVALQAVVPKGSPHPSPQYASSILQRYQFVTKQGVNRKIWFKLIYQTPDFRNPGGDSIFTLERHRRLENVTTNKHPKDNSAITVKWRDPTNPKSFKTPCVVDVPYRQPLLVLVATGYIVGNPPPEYETAWRKVNQTPWQGYPKGYWMYMGADDRTEDYGNSYSIRLEFETKVTEDWSEYAVFRDHTTGNILPVDNKILSFLKTFSYAYSKTEHNGVVKAGLYELAEFNDIFAF
jgi:hypothetical protein